MDFENKNDVLDTENTDEADETAKAMDSFLNGSVYTEEDAKKDREVSRFVTNKEAVICGISLFALVTWSFSVYGALLISALALLGMVFINAGKNATQVCVSNALSVGTLAIIKFALSALEVIVAMFYAFVLEKNSPVLFSNLLSIVNLIISVVIFILFLINAFCLISKSHTPVFGNIAKKFAEREE